MIPILYEKTETAFISNGLGRLRDCISCIVSEERNGIYECDFDYPVDGANYDLIQIGRIIGVTHDDTGDIQPFDIVGFTKPIDGVVSFHCTHISYRLSYHTIRAVTAQNDLASAFAYIQSTAKPACPFTFATDKTSTGYCASIESIPHTVRQVLGGIEGSILDAYGGEYEWDKWTVKLWSARGQMRDFTIRYGVNMLDYNEEYDSSGCYSSCRPYWTDGTNTVVGDVQTTTGITPSGRDQCVPLDVSDKFESQPTKAQVEAMGLSVMNSQNPTLPARSIEISFVRLQDMGETAIYETLLQCRLCDTINVIFPDFNSGGQFKIVKTEWNVLRGKYENMELGTLSVSLADALGITNSLDKEIKTNTGLVYTDSASTKITNTGIDNNTVGASITIPAGTFVVVAQWTFNTRDTSGTTNSAVRILNDAGTAIAQTRVFAATANWNSLQCATTVTSSQGGSLRVCGATSRPYTTATTNWIRAIQIS